MDNDTMARFEAEWNGRWARSGMSPAFVPMCHSASMGAMVDRLGLDAALASWRKYVESKPEPGRVSSFDWAAWRPEAGQPECVPAADAPAGFFVAPVDPAAYAKLASDAGIADVRSSMGFEAQNLAAVLSPVPYGGPSGAAAAAESVLVQKRGWWPEGPSRVVVDGGSAVTRDVVVQAVFLRALWHRRAKPGLDRHEQLPMMSWCEAFADLSARQSGRKYAMKDMMTSTPVLVLTELSGEDAPRDRESMELLSAVLDIRVRLGRPCVFSLAVPCGFGSAGPQLDANAFGRGMGAALASAHSPSAGAYRLRLG